MRGYCKDCEYACAYRGEFFCEVEFLKTKHLPKNECPYKKEKEGVDERVETVRGNIWFGQT